MPQSSETELPRIAASYLRALEQNDEGTASSLLHRDVHQHEYPNRLNPAGAARGYDELLEGMRRGAQVVREQRYEVASALVQGNHVALEVNWSATLQVALGESLPAGSTMRARFALFLDFADGQIIRQRNYDCFDPW